MTILPLAYLGSTEWFARLVQGDCIIDTGENWVKQTVRNRCDIMTSSGIATLTVPVHGYGRKIATRDVAIDNSKNWQHRHWVSIVSAYRNSPYFDHYEEKFAPVYSKKLNYLADLSLEMLSILTGILGVSDRVLISENYIVASPRDVDLRGKKEFRRLNDLTFNSPDAPQTARNHSKMAAEHPGSTPEVTLESAPESVPGITPEIACESAPGSTLGITSGSTPGSVFGITTKSAPESVPGITSGIARESTLEASPQLPRAAVETEEWAAPEYVQVFSDRMGFVPRLSIVDLLFCEGPAAADYLHRRAVRRADRR